jgi:hypothetical protein
MDIDEEQAQTSMAATRIERYIDREMFIHRFIADSDDVREHT